MLRRAALVLVLLLLTWGAVAALWLAEGPAAARRTRVARSYARATGGLGLGAGATLEWSARHLDPRLERASNCDAFPVPGGPGFCPDQTTGLFAPPDELEGLPSLRRAAGSSSQPTDPKQETGHR